jgi:hypothetical protein
VLSLERAYLRSLPPEGFRTTSTMALSVSARAAVQIARPFRRQAFTGVGSIPMRSLTADEIRWVQPSQVARFQMHSVPHNQSC